MTKKHFILLSIIGICVFFLIHNRYDSFIRGPAQRTSDSDRDQERLKTSIECALEKLLPETSQGLVPAERERAQITLNFLYRRLSQKIVEYGLNHWIEKAHFIAQIFHETENFHYMVEQAGGVTWRSVRDTANSYGWNCDVYYNAIMSDRNFFNKMSSELNAGEYVYNYRSAYRGRGLIHLTHCHNYLSFFYHKAALDANRSLLVQEINPELYYVDNANNELQIKWNTFCGDDILQNIVEFKRERLIVRPQEIISSQNNFENTIDNLSLPCQGRGVSSMSSLEFLVDSAFNYWRKCQTDGRYKGHRQEATGKAVALLSECIHGAAWGLYRTFDESSCTIDDNNSYTGMAKENITDGIKEKRRWIVHHYCARLRNFQVLQECFS